MASATSPQIHIKGNLKSKKAGLDMSTELSPTPSQKSDPFASQRQEVVNPFTNSADSNSGKKIPSNMDEDFGSDEWDASKTPPSRFQQRKGSVYATPNSRDGHVDKNYERDAVFHAKHAEKGWGIGKWRRGRKASVEKEKGMEKKSP